MTLNTLESNVIKKRCINRTIKNTIKGLLRNFIEIIIKDFMHEVQEEYERLFGLFLETQHFI
jgi:hypothetical protein